MPIKSRIRTIPDHPKKGIMFRDITTLIKDPVGFRLVIDNLTQRYITGEIDFDIIVGIEARGFIIGGALSYTLGKGFVPVRKIGKLLKRNANARDKISATMVFIFRSYLTS